MKSVMNNKVFSFLIFILLSISVWGQYNIPEKPVSDQSLIFDYSGGNLLSLEEKQQLNQKLIDYEKKTSTQIILVLVKNLNGEDENQLAVNWAHKWGVGQKGKDNGLIILLSEQDRKVSIQNGYGLEEFMTDAMSRRVIFNYMIPEFKQGNYYAGLNKGTDAIINILEGQFVEDGKKGNTQNGERFNTLLIFLFLAFFLYLMFRNRRGGGGNGGRRSNRDVIFTDFGRSVWVPRSGGFGSGGNFGSGGFGGFGGGGFGGGGASGSW